MSDALPKAFKPGDELLGRHIDALFREFWRWRKAVAAPPLEIHDVASDTDPPKFYYDPSDTIVPFQAGSAVAAGSIASPTSFTATLLAAAGAAGFTTTGAGTTTFGRNEQTHPLLPGLTYWGVWRNGYLYSAAAAPPVCLGVTTSAITAATFGGADGSGTATITYPDGSTASVSVGNRSTTAFATSKNAMCFWVPNKNKWYVLVDC